MDASRLVFVSVKDAKPRRKIAVPVPDDYTWEQFLLQVQTKLKLAGIDSIYLVSSGEKITRLDDLQDIDELHVIEGSAPAQKPHPNENGGPLYTDSRAQSGHGATTSGNGSVGVGEQQDASPVYQNAPAHGTSVHRVGVADMRALGQAPGDGEGDIGQKYAKRSSGIRRSLQRFFPSFFQPGLPVTSRDLKEEGRRGSDVRPMRRRKRGRMFTLRNVVTFIMVLGFLAVLSLLYSRLWPRLP
ncbi:g154 [Coccomyxa elongata]